MSIKISVTCMCTCCKRHNGDHMSGKCTEPEMVSVGRSGVCLWMQLPNTALPTAGDVVAQNSASDKADCPKLLSDLELIRSLVVAGGNISRNNAITRLNAVMAQLRACQ